MAKKIKSPAPAKGADDLAVLHPERKLEIGGKTITVREYGFLEGLKIQRSSVVLVKALVEAQKEGDAPYNTIQSVLSDHADTLVELMAAAADVDPDWIRGLSDADGQLLMGTWWMVNGPFFVRRVALERRRRADLIVDVSHGFGGGKETERLIRELTKD